MRKKQKLVSFISLIVGVVALFSVATFLIINNIHTQVHMTGAINSGVKYAVIGFAGLILILAFLFFTTFRMELVETKSNVKVLYDKVYTLLNNSGAGFLSFGRNMLVDSEYSKECEVIFGQPIGGESIAHLLFPNKPDSASEFIKNINIVLDTEDEFKRGMILSLLPNNVSIRSAIIKIKYRVLDNYKVILILTDITIEKNLEEKLNKEQQKLKLIVSSIIHKQDVFECVDSYIKFQESGLKKILEGPQSLQEKLYEISRIAHTFKGLFSQFDFIHVIPPLHHLESELSELIKNPDSTLEELIHVIEKSRCKDAFMEDLQTISDVLGEIYFDAKRTIQIDETQIMKIERLAEFVEEHLIGSNDSKLKDTLSMIKTLRFVDIKTMLKSYPDYVQKLAEKSGKSIYNFEITGDYIMVDPDKYFNFTRTLIHVFRNAVDHGIESPDERLESGKDEIATIHCSAQILGGQLKIMIEDDGRGMDFDKIMVSAIKKGIISVKEASMLSEEEKLNLIFKDGLSTKETVSEISGRGVGLSSVLSELEKVGGGVEIITIKGKGTKFVFSL